MIWHATFIGKLFSEKELIRRESEKKISVLEKIIKIQGEALELYGDGQYLKGDAENVIKNLAGPQLQVFIPGKLARQALKEVEELLNSETVKGIK